MGTRRLGAPGGEIQGGPAFRTGVCNNKEFARAVWHGASVAPAARHVQLIMLTPAVEGNVMDSITLVDRRNAATPLRRYRLDSQALRWRDSEDGAEDNLPLASVRQIRLAVEMAGQDSQIVCRITDAGGREVALGSKRWAGVGQWEANAREFRDFLRYLHLFLADLPGPVRYIEGSSLKFLLVMTSIGAVIAAVGAGFFAKLFLIDENAIGLLLIPAIAMGGWMMRLFWPRAAKHYDPAVYTTDALDENPDAAAAPDTTLAENEASVTTR